MQCTLNTSINQACIVVTTSHACLQNRTIPIHPNTATFRAHCVLSSLDEMRRAPQGILREPLSEQVFSDLVLAAVEYVKGMEEPYNPKLGQEYTAQAIPNSLKDYMISLFTKMQTELEWPWPLMLYTLELLHRLVIADASHIACNLTENLGLQMGWDDLGENRVFKYHLLRVWGKYPNQLKRLRDAEPFTYRNPTNGSMCFHAYNQHYALAVCFDLAQKCLLDGDESMDTKHMAQLLGYPPEYVTRLAEQEYQTCCRLRWNLHVTLDQAYELGAELAGLVYHRHRCVAGQARFKYSCQKRLCKLYAKAWKTWRFQRQDYAASCEFAELETALRIDSPTDPVNFALANMEPDFGSLEQMEPNCVTCGVV